MGPPLRWDRSPWEESSRPLAGQQEGQAELCCAALARPTGLSGPRSPCPSLSFARSGPAPVPEGLKARAALERVGVCAGVRARGLTKS